MIRLFILLAFIFIMMFVICGKNDYDKCYSDMEYRGCAAMNCCRGLSGGTKNTGYLSENCIGCPYLVIEYDFKDYKGE